jgi:hypothetical protein
MSFQRVRLLLENLKFGPRTLVFPRIAAEEKGVIAHRILSDLFCLQICDEEQAFCGCATAMDKMLLKLWTKCWVLYSSICFFFSQLTIGVAAVVMRRQFFPEEEMLLLKDLIMSDPKQQLVDPSSRSMSKYCTEPCTSLVFEISNNCHNCLAAHPQIHNYVQMAHWQLASDVLIALAYFSIPIELLFFIYKAQVPIANSSID